MQERKVYLTEHLTPHGDYKVLDKVFLNREEALENIWIELARIPSEIEGFDSEVHQETISELKSKMTISVIDTKIVLSMKDYQFIEEEIDGELVYGIITPLQLI